MGLFDVMKRMAQGKPAFEVPPPDKADNWDDEKVTAPVADTPATPNAYVNTSGAKIVPEARIGHSEYHNDGTHHEVWAHIRNNSPTPIQLDKIRMLGQMLELDSDLVPGAERQYKLYSGERPRNTSYTTAELYYRNDRGDYFCANHYIEYHQENDGTFAVEEFKLLYPIKDV